MPQFGPTSAILSLARQTFVTSRKGTTEHEKKCMQYSKQSSQRVNITLLVLMTVCATLSAKAISWLCGHTPGFSCEAGLQAKRDVPATCSRSCGILSGGNSEQLVVCVAAFQRQLPSLPRCAIAVCSCLDRSLKAVRQTLSALETGCSAAGTSRLGCCEMMRHCKYLRSAVEPGPIWRLSQG